MTRISLASVVVAMALIVLAAASGPSVLVPESSRIFAGWEAGPLGVIPDHVVTDPAILNIALSAVLLAMFVPYRLICRAAPDLTLRTLAATVALLHAIVLLSPPLVLTDVFNYLGYARLGGLHHLSPYAHGIGAERFDPVSPFASWHNLRSPYGELFTAITYPLGMLPLPVAYWTLKTITVALSLAFLAIVCRCAQLLGGDPRRALAFVALNPAFLVYELGGFHNDAFMLVPAMAALCCVQCGRDRRAGAWLTIAVAVKFTAVLLGPFLLTAVGVRRRRERLMAGAALALAPIAAISVGLFGASLPNLGQQSTLLIPTSVPNLVGLAFGVGGDRLILDLADGGHIARTGWPGPAGRCSRCWPASRG
jgi:hypothetical protein